MKRESKIEIFRKKSKEYYNNVLKIDNKKTKDLIILKINIIKKINFL